MTTYCLASEYHRLTPAQQSQVDHILIDDGEWTEAQIASAMGQDSSTFDIEQEKINGYAYDAT